MPARADTLEEQVRRLVAVIPRLAAWHWRRHGCVCDVSEYEDAALDALTGCLARYDPARDVRFTTYANYRIAFALRDAGTQYMRWHVFAQDVQHTATVSMEEACHRRLDLDRRLASLSPKQRRVADGILAGYTQQELADQEGLTLGAITRRVWEARKPLRATRAAPSGAEASSSAPDGRATKDVAPIRPTRMQGDSLDSRASPGAREGRSSGRSRRVSGAQSAPQTPGC